MTPTFSICHATARVSGSRWKPSHDAWLANADSPDQVEYVLAVHYQDWNEAWAGCAHRYVVVYHDPRNSVHGWNVAASHSTGMILILNADDFFPPPHWDSLLLDKIVGLDSSRYDTRCNFEELIARGWSFAVHVSTGNPDQAWDRRLMALGIISRPLYERWGYALYPEYESMDSDVDMTEHAYQDGLVIQAFDIVVEHMHPALGKGQDDEVYRKQNRPEAYALGHTILERRRAEKFAK